MQQHTWVFAISSMARVLQVSRSGFYAWVQRQSQVSERQCQREALDQQVKAVFEARKKRSGSPRLTLELGELGVHRNPKTIAKSMQRQGLQAKACRPRLAGQGLQAKGAAKFKATTNSKHQLPVAPNLLQQNFTAEQPNQKWVSDITYRWTAEGWLYLAIVLDLYSRKVVGWAMSESMTTTLVCDALQMALWRRKMPIGVIVHSDRGSQYCARAYQDLLTAH